MSRAKPRVFILIPSFQPHDAVGNDALGMYEFLKEAGYDVRLMAEHIHPAYKLVAATLTPEMDDCWQDPKAITIYHHSIQWDLGETILRRSKNRIVIKYHNVTPPEFFAPYNENYYYACVNGVEATKRLAGFRIDYIWGDSLFNAEEFVQCGVPAERCRVVPPIHRVEDLGRSPMDAVVSGQYRERRIILFVGAFRPNKGHFKALEVFSAYRRMGGRAAQLLFAGSFDPRLQRYITELEEHARRLEVDDGLSFCTSVSASQLRSLYNVAAVFLCVSEHEGFCVPLVEAMYFRTPIVAWASTAVGETCGGCGIVHQEYKAEALAEEIEACMEDPVLCRKLASEGRLRYETAFHPDVIQDKFFNLLEEVERL
jgi:glycosyltransferase involved in cell wall biosynthesis